MTTTEGGPMLSFRSASFLAAVFLATCIPFAAQAQGFVGGRGRFGDGVSTLLLKTQVQKEVGLTADQLAALMKLVEADRAANDVNLKEFDYAAFEKLSRAEQEKQRESLAQKRQERSSQLDERIKSLLSFKQWTRLNEIRIQQSGVWSFARKEVQKELGLTQEQITKIQTLIKQANTLPQNGAPDLSPEGRRKAREMNEVRQRTFHQEMTAVLTQSQAEVWSKLKGDAFEISP